MKVTTKVYTSEGKYKAMAICVISELYGLLSDALGKYHTTLISCTALDEAQQLLSTGEYCLIVLDASSLTSNCALEGVERMRTTTAAPFLIVAPSEMSRRLLEAGADICIPNHVSKDIVVAHAVSLFRRYDLYDHYDKIQPDRKAIQRGDIFIDPARYTVLVRSRPIELRFREFLLLHYFMRNPHLVLTPEQICAGAWGLETGYGSDVSGPIAILRHAIEPTPHEPIYIETVHQVGYRFTARAVESCDN